jgi:hypothetical protein
LGGAAAPALPERIAPFLRQDLPLPFFAYFAWFAVKTSLFGFAQSPKPRAQSRCFPICVHPVCGYISGLFFAFLVFFCGKNIST